MRAACIDIGSNTTRLLVADCERTGLTEIHQERAFTRLGRGLGPGGAIADDKIDEVVAVVVRQLQVAREHDVVAMLGVATAAVRTAVNGAALVEAIRARTGLEVAVLSAAEEARLAFCGAAAMLDATPAGELGVIDVGGGSSEIVVGRPPDRVEWWASLAVGSGALAEEHFASDPPTADELSAARGQVAQALAGHTPPRPALAVAVGGSATSLSRVAGPVLDANALARSLHLLAELPAEAVAARFAIDPERARLLPGGLLILEAAAGLLGTPVRVGRGGIREGVLLEALAS